jgi:hypothetical protein
MDVSLAAERPDRLIATLRDGRQEAVVTASYGRTAGSELLDALAHADRDGYGECFWHEQAGQYWWLFRRTKRTVEVAVLWSSGTVTGWQHVFRATDDLDTLADRLRAELGADSADTPD